MILTRTLQTAIEKAKLIVTVLKKGKSDTVECQNVTPYGFESRPIKDMVAIYSDTEMIGTSVIIGYINKNALAQIGESRMFSTDAGGNLKTFVWCKNDGTIRLGGNADNSVRYSPLNSGLSDFKDKINAELTKIQTAITSLGGTYAKVNTTVDISGSKINEIKTP